MAKTTINPRQAFSVDEGILDETTPPILDGLVAQFPLHGNTEGISYQNITLTEGIWEDGQSGSVGNFSQNGATVENTRILKDNPWGNESVVWATEVNDVASSSDGGWNHLNSTIDNTKRYRLSVWIRRENPGDGRSYFGCQASTVDNLGGTILNTNPYFTNFLHTELPEIVDNWVLLVYYIHPYGYAGGDYADNGGYLSNGTKVWTAGTDFKWTNGITIGGHRTYLYYSTATTERQYWHDPRMELYDATTSSTIEEMLKGSPEIYHVAPTAAVDISISSSEDVGIGDAVTNHIVNPTGNNGATADGSVTPGWDVALHPKAISVSSWGVGYNGGVQVPATGYHAQWVREGYDGSPCMKFIDYNTFYGYAHRWLGISGSVTTDISSKGWTTGTILTVSWRQKVSNLGKYSEFGFYHSESSSNTFGTALWNRYNTKPNVWENVSVTYTITSAWDTTSFFTMYCYGMKGDEGILWADNLQITETNKQIPFVDGSRAVESILQIDMREELDTYTIVGKFTPYSPFDGTYTYTASSSSLFRIGDTVNVGNMYYRYWVSGSASGPYLDADGAFGTDHTHQYYDIDKDEELIFAITKTNTNFSLKIFQNGAWKATHSDVITGTILSFISFGSTTIWNGHYRDLSIYRRILTSTELDIMATSMYTLESNGNLQAIVDDNMYPNLWKNANFETTSYQVQGNGTVTLESDSEGLYHQMIISSLTYTYRGYSGLSDISEKNVSGIDYIMSGWFWLSVGNTLTEKVLRVEGGVGSVVYEYSNISSCPTGVWFYATVSFTSTDTDGVNCYVYANASVAGSGTIKWRNISIRRANTSETKLIQDIFEVGDFLENE